MFFFMRDWAELLDVPDMDKLVPDLGPLVKRLAEAQANQYRFFRFDAEGAIKACFVFLRMDDHFVVISLAQDLCLAGRPIFFALVRYGISNHRALGAY